MTTADIRELLKYPSQAFQLFSMNTQSFLYVVENPHIILDYVFRLESYILDLVSEASVYEEDIEEYESFYEEDYYEDEEVDDEYTEGIS